MITNDNSYLAILQILEAERLDLKAILKIRRAPLDLKLEIADSMGIAYSTKLITNYGASSCMELHKHLIYVDKEISEVLDMLSSEELQQL